MCQKGRRIHSCIFAPCLQKPNLEETDYLGTRYYTAECYRTQHCMAEDTAKVGNWEAIALGFCVTGYHIFYSVVVLAKQKAKQLAMHLFPSLQGFQRVKKCIILLRLKMHCYWQQLKEKGVKCVTSASNRSDKFTWLYSKRLSVRNKEILIPSIYILRHSIGEVKTPNCHFLQNAFKASTLEG